MIFSDVVDRRYSSKKKKKYLYLVYQQFSDQFFLHAIHMVTINMVSHKSLSWCCVSCIHMCCGFCSCVLPVFSNSKYPDSNFHCVHCIFFCIILKLLDIFENRDQIRSPESFFINWLPYLSYPDSHSCVFFDTHWASNCCLLSARLLEPDLKWSLLQVGILCSRWPCPGRSQQHGGCWEGTVLPHYWYHTCWLTCHSEPVLLTECGDENHLICIWIIAKSENHADHKWCMISSLNMSIPGIPYMPVFKAPPVALWRSEHCTSCWLVGWWLCTVGCWAIESGARRRWMDF